MAVPLTTYIAGPRHLSLRSQAAPQHCRGRQEKFGWKVEAPQGDKPPREGGEGAAGILVEAVPRRARGVRVSVWVPPTTRGPCHAVLGDSSRRPQASRDRRLDPVFCLPPAGQALQEQRRLRGPRRHQVRLRADVCQDELVRP